MRLLKTQWHVGGRKRLGRGPLPLRGYEGRAWRGVTVGWRPRLLTDAPSGLAIVAWVDAPASAGWIRKSTAQEQWHVGEKSSLPQIDLHGFLAKERHVTELQEDGPSGASLRVKVNVQPLGA
jgi:hypothetical protein